MSCEQSCAELRKVKTSGRPLPAQSMACRLVAIITLALLLVVQATAAGIVHDQVSRTLLSLTRCICACPVAPPPPPPRAPSRTNVPHNSIGKPTVLQRLICVACLQVERLELRMPAHLGEVAGREAAEDAARVAAMATHVQTMSADHAPVVTGVAPRCLPCVCRLVTRLQRYCAVAFLRRFAAAVCSK